MARLHSGYRNPGRRRRKRPLECDDSSVATAWQP
jgi:hypothetical protein